MLKFVTCHLKTKVICTNAVKILAFVTMCVPDRHKAQGICDKVILENSGMLKLIPDCYKNQEICDKSVDNLCPCIRICPRLL